MGTRYRNLLIGAIAVCSIAGGTIYYVFNAKFSDTADTRPDYTVNAIPFIKEFQKNDSAANAHYTEKIISVNGIISEVSAVDTTANVKFTDSISGDYIIFDFQPQHVAEVRKVRKGDMVSIKGSCSGGNYSEILGTRYITFKRSTLNN